MTGRDMIAAEIARREDEIATLRQALAILDGAGPASEPAPKRQLALPPPKSGKSKAAKAPPSKRFRAKTGFVITVNGTDITMSEPSVAVIEMLQQAEDCVPTERLLPLWDNVNSRMHVALSSLNKRLETAGAEIVFFRGEGYRLQNIEAGQ